MKTGRLPDSLVDVLTYAQHSRYLEIAARMHLPHKVAIGAGGLNAKGRRREPGRREIIVDQIRERRQCFAEVRRGLLDAEKFC